MTKPVWSCDKAGHEFFRVSDERVCCSKCGEFRDAATFAPAPYYVPPPVYVPYPAPTLPNVYPWWDGGFVWTGTKTIVSGGTAGTTSGEFVIGDASYVSGESNPTFTGLTVS